MQRDQYFGEQEIGLATVSRMLRRRYRLISVIAAILLTVVVLIAVVWPATYRSSATVLIEQPDVPSELIRSAVTAIPDERLRRIEQRVMTTQNLITVIDKLELYRDERAEIEASALSERIKRRLGLELIRATVTDPNNGREVEYTIGFSLRADDRNPRIAQRLVNEVVTLYLSENLRSRQEQAQGTTGFLSGESDRLLQQISDLETQLASFKRENVGRLPEDVQANVRLLERNEQQLISVMSDMQSLSRQRDYLQDQLAGLDPYAPVGAGDESTLTGAALQSHYQNLLSRFGENHPDVVRVRRQLEQQGVVPQSSTNSLVRRAELQAELTSARQRFGASHPEVIRLERLLDSLQTAPAASSSARLNPTNPVYARVQTDLAQVTANLSAASLEVETLRQRIEELEARAFQSPEVERAYTALSREYNERVSAYEVLKQKQIEADLAQSLESERRGERFVIIEPPTLPLSPVSPNRPLIIALGAFLAFGAGVGTAFLVELLSGKVRGEGRLQRIVGEPPLAVIPVSAKPRKFRWAGAFGG
ncbi:MAG: hypothetical protein AAFX52_05470 [Pseudomonadota bacterium]